MEVKRLTGNTAPMCHKTAEIFANSREAAHLLKGIVDKKTAVQAYFASQFAYWEQIGEIWVVGDNEGMLAGHYSTQDSTWKLIKTTLQSFAAMKREVDKKDRNQFSKNARAASGVNNVRWRKQTCKQAAYYYIDLIAVDPSLKGTGAFRKLLEPILIRAEKEKMPVLLDTHDKANVSIYQHFGFELVEQFTAKKDENLVQYAMIKWS